MPQTKVNLYDVLMEQLMSCFTPDALERLIALRFPDEYTSRLDELGEKCNEGKLTEEEELEYRAFVELSSTIGAMQALARQKAKGHHAA